MDSSRSKNNNPPNSVHTDNEYLRFCGPARRQNWSIPDKTIFHIAKNPKSPRFYEKIIRTCKYFFIANPITICSQLTFMNGENGGAKEKENGEQKNESNDKRPDVWQIKQDLIISNVMYGKFDKNVELKSYFAKIWIVDPYSFNYTALSVENSDNKYLVSSTIPKMYRCNAGHVLLNDQDITFNEFAFLAASAGNIEFHRVTVKDDDGMVVPVEKLLQVTSRATLFTFDCNDNGACISSETFINLLQIPHFSKAEFFTLHNIPDSFDVDTFFTYAKSNKVTAFDLQFSDSISAAYKKRLEKIVDEIIDAGNRGGYISPLIHFPGNDEEKHQCVYMLYLGFTRAVE